MKFSCLVIDTSNKGNIERRIKTVMIHWCWKARASKTRFVLPKLFKE